MASEDPTQSEPNQSNLASILDNVGNSLTKFIGNDNMEFMSKNKVSLLMGFVITIIFILVATFGYDNYVKPILDKSYVPNKEFIKEDGNNNIVVYFFYTTWCPYCKKARIEWDKFKKEIEENNLLQQTFNITFKEIDCDKNSDLAKKFNVEGYPTIKMEKNNKIFNYDAKPSASHLMEFFNGSL